MACLHWLRLRPRPIKNGLKRIVWRCSYCKETETDANFHWVAVHILSASVLISVSESGRVKEPLHFKCGFTCRRQENVPHWAVTSDGNTFRRNYQCTFSYQKTCLEAGDTHTLRTNVLLPIIYHVVGQFLCHVPQLFPESFIHRSQKFHFTFSFLCCIRCFWQLP